MTRAPSVSVSPVEWLCSCVSVSFFLLLSLSCRCSSISPLQFAAWPADPCQPQLIKSDTSSNTELAQLTIFPWNLPHHCFFGVFWFYSNVYNTRTLCHMFWLFSSPYGFVNQMKSPAVLQKPFSMATNQLTEWKRRTRIQLLFRVMTERAVRSSVLMISSRSSVIIPVLIALPVLPPT